MATKTLEIKYEEFTSPDELPEDEQNLIAQAWETRKSAYAPYSHFRVGAAVLTKSGEVFLGNNQETANFRANCAEGVVLNTAAAANGTENKVSKLAIVGGPESMDPDIIPEEPEEPVTPCGECRQEIKEAEDRGGTPITIIVASRNRIRRFVGVDTLLPFSFGPANLGIQFHE